MKEVAETISGKVRKTTRIAQEQENTANARKMIKIATIAQNN
tara:strand:- start:283 stop:408 length:126 start_codon:yes stop_codon:yes gene_type:complete